MQKLIINTPASRDLASEVLAALKEGKEVKVTGLGVFYVKTVAAHEGRNPRTGATIQIGEKAKIKFRASTPAKAAIK